MFVILEMAGIEPVNIQLFSSFEKAKNCFDNICYHNGLLEDFLRPDECPGTIVLAGDDVYSVQLFERNIEE